MLRITSVPSIDGFVLLHLAGRIGAAEAELLQEQLQNGSAQPQALDLAGVQFIDETGLGLLQRWVGDGLELRGGSAFIRRLLEERGLLGTQTPPLTE